MWSNAAPPTYPPWVELHKCTREHKGSQACKAMYQSLHWYRIDSRTGIYLVISINIRNTTSDSTLHINVDVTVDTSLETCKEKGVHCCDIEVLNIKCNVLKRFGVNWSVGRMIVGRGILGFSSHHVKPCYLMNLRIESEYVLTYPFFHIQHAKHDRQEMDSASLDLR